jgi:DNA polymerase III sliding clamp (beta) subunit (PCNA family)
MQVIAGENILLEFNDEMSAGVIKSEKDKDFVYIVMPLRIDN